VKNPLENFLPASIFWDQDGILLVDYLPKGQTINVAYYRNLLVQLKDILKETLPENFTKGVLFLHDNAPARREFATQKKRAYLGFHSFDHTHILRIWPRRTSTCSPDLKKTIERPLLFFRHGCHCAAETWLDEQFF
jgi:hypothetical protein